jgi:Zn-dependent protease with chaperone function
LGPSVTEVSDELRRLSAAAGVAAPILEVRIGSRRLAMVRRRRDDTRLVIRPETLTLPPPVLRGILAHEVAHIARGHPVYRRWVRASSVAAIWLLFILLSAVLAVEIIAGRWWLWPIWAAAWLAAIVGPRVALLAILRRQEYAADRTAATLLGSPDPVVAFLDWVSSHGGELPAAPLPVRLWNATHPSNAARRQAVLAGASMDRPARSSRL